MGLRCENFVRYDLPVIKKELSKMLYEKYNLPQEEIAKKLLITQAAVSQYISGLRGRKKIIMDEEEYKIISELGYLLYKDRNKALLDFQDLLCTICKNKYK
ncbi:Fis family transcriptional regulator [Nanobdella aerobiophila]|uniref:Fis family transcriptional regulator n=1 Tax=Nanobdella aerobiophila TaxID=2586965 RepID=A0A915SL53_9ARCH|nr:helix-turn-helix domain-containing protein [Nanobdella aerobiophila]BBL45751.1 Fis family transcriptional regulator [Nanobdella aerobiophila]